MFNRATFASESQIWRVLRLRPSTVWYWWVVRGVCVWGRDSGWRNSGRSNPIPGRTSRSPLENHRCRPTGCAKTHLYNYVHVTPSLHTGHTTFNTSAKKKTFIPWSHKLMALVLSRFYTDSNFLNIIIGKKMHFNEILLK